MNEQDTPEPGDRVKAAWDEGAREIGEQVRAQHERARALILKNRSRNMVGEVYSLGPITEDDYIAEEIRHGYAHGHELYRVVVGGKLLPEASETKDFALLLYVAASNDTSDQHNTEAARWAARTLGIPNGYDS